MDLWPRGGREGWTDGRTDGGSASERAGAQSLPVTLLKELVRVLWCSL